MHWSSGWRCSIMVFCAARKLKRVRARPQARAGFSLTCMRTALNELPHFKELK